MEGGGGGWGLATNWRSGGRIETCVPKLHDAHGKTCGLAVRTLAAGSAHGWATDVHRPWYVGRGAGGRKRVQEAGVGGLDAAICIVQLFKVVMPHPALDCARWQLAAAHTGWPPDVHRPYSTSAVVCVGGGGEDCVTGGGLTL